MEITGLVEDPPGLDPAVTAETLVSDAWATGVASLSGTGAATGARLLVSESDCSTCWVGAGSKPPQAASNREMLKAARIKSPARHRIIDLINIDLINSVVTLASLQNLFLNSYGL